MSRNTHDRLLDHHGTDTTANIVLASATQTYTAGLTVQSVLADLDGRIIGSSVSWKGPCIVATTGNVNLSTGLVNGTVIDGVTLATGNRVLVRAQTTASENGIYVVPASGAASRASDADSGPELEGAAVVVQRGTTYADTIWLQTADNVVIDTTAINWVQVRITPGTLTTSSAPGDTTSHGTSDTYARSDHRHGREQHGTAQHSAGTVVPTAVAGSSAPGDTAAEGTASTLARSDHRHGREQHSTAQHSAGTVVPTATAGASAPGDTAAEGTATTLARSDHRHSREQHGAAEHAVGTVILTGIAGSSAPGDTAAEGTATTLARSDHRHGREQHGTAQHSAGTVVPTATAGSSAPGDTAAEGTATTLARSDHRHGREQHGTSEHAAGTIVPTAAAGSSAPGDTAAEGTATTLARSDHRHSREAYATTAEIADVAATEAAGTSSTVARGDHVHALANGVVTTDKIAARTIHAGHFTGSPRNLIPNPGFEEPLTGTIDADRADWRRTGGGTFTRTQETPRSGGWNGRANNTSGVDGYVVSARFPIAGGRRYRIRGWARGNSSQNVANFTVTLRVRWWNSDLTTYSDVTVASAAIGTVNTYTEFTNVLTAPSTAAYAHVFWITPSDTGTGVVYIDDMEMYEVDEDHALGKIAVRLTADQTISTGTATTVVFQTIDQEDDPGGDISYSTSTGVFTINRAGWYQMTAAVQWASNSTGERYLAFELGSGTRPFNDRRPATTTAEATIAALMYLTATTTVKVVVLQSSGGNLALSSASSRTRCAIARLL